MRLHVPLRADSQNAFTLNGDGLGPRAGGVHGDDARIVENERGRQSRYYTEPRGCSYPVDAALEL
jgi:hypothetical protein